MSADPTVSVALAPDSPRTRATEWDQVVRAAGGGLFHSAAWLRAYERAGVHRSRPYHLVARAGERLVGVLPCYLTAGCPRLQAMRGQLVDRPTWLDEPMLLSHALAAYYGGPLALADAACALDALVEAFGRLAADLGVSAHGFVNVPPTQPALLATLRRHGYVLRYHSSCMVLPLPWRTFDEYLASLPGKRRRMVNAMERRSEASGMVAELVGRPPDLETLSELEASVLRRHGHLTPSSFPSPYLRVLVEELDGSARFLVVRRLDGSPSLFFLVLDDGTCLSPWVAGIDYDRLRPDEPYHHAYRWLIRYGIGQRYRQIDMGRGSYRFKTRYGFARRELSFALATSRAECRRELARWSDDFERNQRARYDREFPVHATPPIFPG